MVKKYVLPRSLKKRLISSLMSSYNNSSQSPNFALKSSAEFASRSTGIFGELKVLEKDHETWVSQNETLEKFEEKETNVTDVPVVFKKPFAVKRKMKSSTENKRRKWTKYSLADVPLSSNATNTAVAMQFLNDLRAKKEREKYLDKSKNTDKIVFSKPKARKSERLDVSFPVFSSTASNAKESTSCLISAEQHSRDGRKISASSVQLGHLLTEDSDI